MREPPPVGRRLRASGPARVVGSLLAVALVAGCAPSTADRVLARQRARELVAATRDAGVAPGMTVAVAQSLYGTDAPTACDVLGEDGLSDSAALALVGNLALGRRKTITDEAVTYGRLVVQTYCPDELDTFEEVVRRVDPYEATDT